MPPPAEGFAPRFILGPALRAQPDRRLVSLVREGYETAFEEIVRRYGRPLARYAATIVGGRSEDVTQDAFSKALLALRRSDSEIELRPWLFRIVRNTALNDLRDSPPSPEALADAIAGGRDPAEALEQREALADLMRRLQALPEPQRAAIVMRELEGLGHDEIAAALGLSGGAARQAIYRARQALRGGLGMLVPLPLLKAMLAGAGTTTAEAAAGAAGLGGAAGAGVALKATAATVLVAGAVGAGVALENGRHEGDVAVPAAAAKQSAGAAGHETSDAAPGPAVRQAGGSDDRRGGSASHHSGESEQGDSGGRDGTGHADDRHGTNGSSDHGGEGPSRSGGGDDHRGPSRPEASDHSGRDGGSGEDSGSGDGHSGSGESSEPEGDSGSGSGSGSGEDGSRADSGSGSEEDGSGGSGSGDSGDSHASDGLTEQTTPEP